MALSKVWNRNKYEHREKFKGDEIVIPPGGYIEMEFEDAIQFKGQWTPMPPEDFVGDEAKYYKMIQVEWPKQHEEKPNAHLVNHATGQTAASAEELKAMLSQFADRLVKDPEADKAANRSRDAEMEALKAQVAALAAQIESQTPKRGPGRPRKDEAVTT